MDFGLIDLPQSKWGAGTGRQAILKGDFGKIEAAIIQSFGIMAPPRMEWVDATSIKVPATADSPAPIMLNGFPNVLHPGMMVSGGLTDGRYRENTADAVMDFDLATALWGAEKVSQWYIIYALAGNAATVFTLKAMPMMRHSSQASQVITLRNNLNIANIGYGFATDELVGGKIYVLSGASQGLLRTITANNNDNGTGGTITYSGTALTLAQGDWFVVLPPGTNFRVVGEIFNTSAGAIDQFVDNGRVIQWLSEEWVAGLGNGVIEKVSFFSPLAKIAIGNGANVSVGHPLIPANQTYLLTNFGAYAVSSYLIEFCTFRSAGGGGNFVRGGYYKPNY